MVTAQMIINSLNKSNDYYDRCYKCNKLNTDGWGDEACTNCQKETEQMFQELGYTFDREGNIVKI